MSVFSTHNVIFNTQKVNIYNLLVLTDMRQFFSYVNHVCMSATWNEQMHCYEPSCDFHQAEHSVFVPPSPPGDVEWIHCLPWCCGAFVKSSTPWPVFYSFLSLDLRHHDAPESTFFTKTSCKKTWINKSINPKSHEQIGVGSSPKKHPKKNWHIPLGRWKFPLFSDSDPKNSELRGSTAVLLHGHLTQHLVAVVGLLQEVLRREAAAVRPGKKKVVWFGDWLN